MKIYTVRPAGTAKRRPTYHAVEFTGSMRDTTVAHWAKGRLKGGSGRFVIEIDLPDSGETIYVDPHTVILRNDKTGALTTVPSTSFHSLYEILNEEES